MTSVPNRTLVALVALMIVGALLASLEPITNAQDRDDAPSVTDRLPSRIDLQQPAQADVTTLTVRATGSVPVTPDMAIVTLAIDAGGPDAGTALGTAAAAATALREALAASDIDTAAIGPANVRLASEGPVPPTDTQAVATVRVVTDDIADLDTLIQAALGSGATRVADVTFTVRDPAAYRAEALAAAVNAAAADAHATAAALGSHIDRIVAVRTLDAEALPARSSSAPPSVDAAVEMVLALSGARLPEPGDTSPTAALSPDDADAGSPSETEGAPTGDGPEADAEADTEAAVEEEADADASANDRGTAGEADESADDGATAGDEDDAAAEDANATSEDDDSRAEPQAASDRPGATGGRGGVDFAPVAQSELARFRGANPRAVVAASPNEWTRKLMPLLPPGTQLDIGWDDELVAAVFLGEKRAPGYAIRVERVVEEDGAIVFVASVTEPLEADAPATGVTSPFHLVRVPRAGLVDAGYREGEGPVRAEVRLLRGR